MTDTKAVLAACATEFNSQLKFLARVYVEKKKGSFDEDKAKRTNQRLSILMSGYPMWMIETAGPFFLKYGKIIQAKKWDEFMAKDFDEEKKRYATTEDGSKHTPKAMDGKIKFIKKVWASCNEKERVKLGECITTLLSAYAKFAIAVKKSGGR